MFPDSFKGTLAAAEAAVAVGNALHSAFSGIETVPMPQSSGSKGRAGAESADVRVISGVARRAGMHSVSCIALCGTLGAGAKKLFASGMTALFGAG